MAFWSGEKLGIELPTLISNFRPARIDCAAYSLSIGNDIFVTAEEAPSGRVSEGVRVTLAPRAQFRIPPGQFAFLHTDEIVKVPDNAIAFISMKATQKFKGLVNVSGFHVDPGWNGQLVFSIYNAGPAPVPLEQGMPLFLIWYSDLDQKSAKVKSMPNPRLGLPNELMANMSGQIFSPMTLGNQFQALARDVVNLRAEVTRFGSLFRWSAGIVMSFIVALSIAIFQLVGEPMRDFLITEWREHKTKIKVEEPKSSVPGTTTSDEPTTSGTKPSPIKEPSLGDQKTRTQPEKQHNSVPGATKSHRSKKSPESANLPEQNEQGPVGASRGQ